MIPRVAFLSDSFHETNGVALTSRQFAHFAQQSGYPFLCVRAGPRTAAWEDGAFRVLELQNSDNVLDLEHDLRFDLLFLRHRERLREAMRAFAPDIVHVTGPGHLGMLGALTAHHLGVPLAASWHTNLHEYSARRMRKLLERWPARWRQAMAGGAERATLDLCVRFYRLARVLFAPNVELTALLERRTGRPAHLMERGIDTGQYSPERRSRTDNRFVIGYVGRLSVEKNVRLLAEMEPLLELAGLGDYRFLIVGDGSERAWLREHLQRADLAGTLGGDALAQAYAGMDVFVFPSETDTYGNVVLEAAASGVPVVVSDRGGPKYLVEDGVTGFVASGPRAFAAAVSQLAADPARLLEMRRNARQSALRRSWSAVFEGVYRHYGGALSSGPAGRPAPLSRGSV